MRGRSPRGKPNDTPSDTDSHHQNPKQNGYRKCGNRRHTNKAECAKPAGEGRAAPDEALEQVAEALRGEGLVWGEAGGPPSPQNLEVCEAVVREAAVAHYLFSNSVLERILF